MIGTLAAAAATAGDGFRRWILTLIGLRRSLSSSSNLVERDAVAETVREPQGRLAPVHVEGDDRSATRVLGCAHAVRAVRTA